MGMSSAIPLRLADFSHPPCRAQARAFAYIPTRPTGNRGEAHPDFEKNNIFVWIKFYEWNFREGQVTCQLNSKLKDWTCPRKIDT